MYESQSAMVTRTFRNNLAPAHWAVANRPCFSKMPERDSDPSSAGLTAGSLASCDATEMLTGRSGFDCPSVLAHSKLFIDARVRYLQVHEELVVL